MPLDRLILILVIIIAAAGATIWLASIVLVSFGVSGWIGLGFAMPTLLVAYIVWKVIADRMNSTEDDHYDNIEN